MVAVERAPVSSAPRSVPEEMSPPVADPLLGLVIAERYRIVEELGRGGMGIVYKVEHTRLGKLLAMKLLTGELARNPDVVRRFKQEALTVSKLSSANTVQVFDFGVAEGGLTYLVMELVAGEDLGRVLRTSGPLAFDRLDKLIIQACTSLAEAHQKGIVHRDIKPENIMLVRGRDGAEAAKVLDFGLAKLREGADLNDVTSQGAIVGTPYYMAPEQIRGEPVDERTDIYALGAVMYRALTGSLPFNGPTPMAVFTKHLAEEPVPPSRRAPARQIPPGADRIVLRALQKDPAARFQSVDELQAALVDEAGALGSSSVEALLDSKTVREIAEAAEGPNAADAGTIATRDEVEAYERTLRRKRYGSWVLLGLLIAVPAAAAVKLVAFAPEEFRGTEREPNNTAGEAMLVPLGRTASGFLGKRLDAARSDRDFYAFDVAAQAPGRPAHIKLHVTALPNLPMCSMLYKQGLPTAFGVYCVGRPGRDLLIPTLRLEPGRYLLGVLQDLDPYGAAAPPFVLENVSDAYALSVEPAEPEPAREVEPNDQVASANAIANGAAMAGALGWARDEDVFCAGAAGSIRWTVTDVVRDAGAVLEVTPIRGSLEAASVRVHVAGRGARSEADVMSPWVFAEAAAEPGASRCLRVRLARDPWAGDRAAPVPSGDREAYVIKVEEAP
jgi:serine/threonine-protein kinase